MASTEAVVYVPVRVVSGRFSTGIAASADGNLRGLLPHMRHPVGKVNKDGTVTMDGVWYTFLQRFFDVFLGGAGVYTLQDVINAVNEAQANSAELLVLTTAVSQQSQETASAVNVIREVAVNNTLSGADQIPRVNTKYWD